MTLSDPDFKVTTFFEVEYYKILQCVINEPKILKINLKENLKETESLKDKVNIAQEETIPNIWNGTMFRDLDLPLNASRRFVIIS